MFHTFLKFCMLEKVTVTVVLSLVAVMQESKSNKVLNKYSSKVK